MARATAVALPIPLVAPVTNAVVPCKSVVIVELPFMAGLLECPPVFTSPAIWLFVVSPDDGHNFDLDVHLRNSQRFHT